MTCYIREIRPDVVITFDPVGGYHHPDHIAIHKSTVRAFYAAGDPQSFPNGHEPFKPEKLYFNVFPRRFIRLAVRLLKLFGQDTTQFGKNKDINLELLAGDENYPAHVRVNYRSVSHLKEQAHACHASQNIFGGQSPLVLRLFRRLTSGKDSFTRAYPPAQDDLRVKDLFAG